MTALLVLLGQTSLHGLILALTLACALDTWVGARAASLYVER